MSASSSSKFMCVASSTSLAVVRSLKLKKDAALLVRAARDTSLHETGGAEGAGECVAELSFGGHEQFGPAL